MKSRLLTLALLAALLACGSRGDPRPPLQLLPPQPPILSVAQHQDRAVLRLDAVPAAVMTADGELAELDRLELLVYAQRYPALTTDLLSVALDRERRERIAGAREAVADAEEAAAERQRQAEITAAIEAAEAAGVEPPPLPEPEVEETAEADEEDTLTEDERTLRRVPASARSAWREAELPSTSILEAAYRLDGAVNALWDYLEMPTAIVDLDRAPALPDPLEVVTAAERVGRTLKYEGAIDRTLFEDDAEIVATFPIDEIGENVFADVFEVSYPVILPGPGPIRTRYFFAIRAISTRGRESLLEQIVPLAPVPVPRPPVDVTANVTDRGVLLSWSAPATNTIDEQLATAETRYNVYRRDPGADPRTSVLLTPTPLAGRLLLDMSMPWNARHLYEVRAVSAPTLLDDEDVLTPETASAGAIGAPAVPVVPPTGPPAAAAGAAMLRREGSGVTAEVLAEDVFAPPMVGNLTAARAALRVTVRWTAVAAPDLRGYRVYRHPAPAPQLPGRLPGLVYPAAAALGSMADPWSSLVLDDPPDFPLTLTKPPEISAAARRRQRRQNLLVDAGWQLLTAIPISESRFIDPTSDPAQDWVYLVEAVDTTGNSSLPAIVTLTSSEQQ